MFYRQILFVLCLLPQSAFGGPFAETAKNTFSPKTLGGDIISPVTTDAKYVLITGTVLTLTTMAFKKDFEEPFDDYMKRERPLGRSQLGHTFGQLIPNIAYAAGMLGAYAVNSNSKYLSRADLMFRTSMHSGVMTLLMKALFRAERPYDPNVKTSFPSGHSSSSFAFASAVAMEHEWYWGAAAYTAATYVAASRINDHQHHLRDVIAGTTLGISYGMGIWYRIQKEKEEVVSPAQGDRDHTELWAVLPTDDLSGAAFLLQKSFR